MANSRVTTAQEYDKYIDNLAIQLHKTAVSIMSIVEECNCRNYEHTGGRYIISITKNENS